MTWNIQGNFAYNKNQVTSLGDHEVLNVKSYTILKKGETGRPFYGLVLTVSSGWRRHQSAAHTKRQSSQGGTGEIPRNQWRRQSKRIHDCVVLGHAQPGNHLHSSSTLRWKHSPTLSAIPKGNSQGTNLQPPLESAADGLLQCFLNHSGQLDSNQPQQYQPRRQRCMPPYSYIDSRFVEDADFKLGLTQSYTIKAIKPTPDGVTANNLFTITSCYEPQIQSGVDTGDYPASRSFTAGVEPSF